MASRIGVCNQAISNLGSAKEIANFDTERSAEALACRRFYEEVVKETLRDFDWPLATKLEALALVATNPNDEWGYSYRYPSDCLKARRIPSGTRPESADSRIKFIVRADSAGGLIYSDQPTPDLEYTFRPDESYWPADFASAVSYLLSARIAPRIIAGDPYGQQEKNLKLYHYQLTKAQKNAGNEGSPDDEPEAEIIRARE